MKHKNIIKIVVSLLAICWSASADAQLGEWLADQLRSEIQNEINKITNHNSATLGSFGSYIWESIVSSKCESDLEEKAGEFKNFPIDRSFLDRAPGKYPLRNTYWTSHRELAPLLYARANSYFHTTRNLQFDMAANAKFKEATSLYVDSLKSRMDIGVLEEVLSTQAMDSIKSFSNLLALRDSLLKDIQDNPRIAMMLNNHPESVRVYHNTLGTPSLRKDPSHLLYWAVKADSHRDYLGKKQKLIDPRKVIFHSAGKVIDIDYNDITIGQLKDGNLYVMNINLMNLMGCPNTTYVLGNSEWLTDNYGRVIGTNQELNKINKKKNKTKSDAKPKELARTMYGAEEFELGYFNDPEYGAPDVLLNIYFYEKSDPNKQALKDIKKNDKTQLKQFETTRNTKTVTYNNPGHIPSSILVADYWIINSNQPESAKSPTVPAKSVYTPMAGNSTTIDTPRHSFVNPTKAAGVSAVTKKVTATTSDKNSTKKSPSTKKAPSGTSSKSTTSKGSIGNQIAALCRSNGLSHVKTEKYKGTIGKYPIVLTLAYSEPDDGENGKAVAVLYYESQGPDKTLTLTGTYTDYRGRYMEFKEYDNGKFNGHLNLNYLWPEIGGTILGQYDNIKNKEYEVTLRRIE